MFLLNQAALLMFVSRCGVFAAHSPVVYRDKLVYRGESTSLTCNKSEADITLIRWMKDSFILAHAVKINETSSNFPDRLRLDHNSPGRLIISNTQDDDKGLYMCNLTGVSIGTFSIQWNLTVSERPKVFAGGAKSFGVSLHVVLPVTVMFLCCIIAAVCFCRKRRQKTPDPNPVYSSPDMQNSTDRRRNNNQRSQYMERLNSIYNAY